MPRGTSWTQQEDLDLCQHWIAASEDPVKGTYQKKDTLWATILNGMGTERTSSAVQNRWSDISRDVLKFIGILTQLLKIYKSGWGVIEYEAQAAIAFKKEQGDDFLLFSKDGLYDKRGYNRLNRWRIFGLASIVIPLSGGKFDSL
jgi:hypothetical protein